MANQHARSLMALIEEHGLGSGMGAEVGVWQGMVSKTLLTKFPELTIRS